MEKYKVTQQFMDALIAWRDEQILDVSGKLYVTPVDIASWPSKVNAWRYKSVNSVERNKRLIAIIQWVNGEDVFEVEKPHKFVVRNTGRNQSDSMVYLIKISKFNHISIPVYRNAQVAKARKFSTREEAELWTTNGYEVVEIDGDDHVLPFQ
ncbi:hypothetical protein KGP40_04420 [Weissella cibaria]|uniref:hypothetical protein n=1 Tax=Weissella cibaria TaxID=137591 RepID=UPI001C1F616E|nr:hypothetical protein [Weissella cibaria]MBU7561160.1 hypothetical protein [Weissella cibaria]